MLHLGHKKFFTEQNFQGSSLFFMNFDAVPYVNHIKYFFLHICRYYQLVVKVNYVLVGVFHCEEHFVENTSSFR